MAKHTPGPWEALYPVGHDDRDWIHIRSDDEGVVVAAVQYRDDARLIANLPDLIEALEKIASLTDYQADSGMAQTLAREAIESATGCA